MPCLVLTNNFCFNTFNSTQSKLLVRQAKSGESGWLRPGPTDTGLKYCGTARQQDHQLKRHEKEPIIIIGFLFSLPFPAFCPCNARIPIQGRKAADLKSPACRWAVARKTPNLSPKIH